MARLDLQMPEGDTIARLPSVDAGEGFWLRASIEKMFCEKCWPVRKFQ
jgi:hypothetical protein